MHPRADPIPTEDQNAQKARLQGKGKNALRGQRRTEDVADVARVRGPVGAELELHDDARRHANPKNEGKDLDPEAGELFPLAVAGAQVLAFEQHHAQPNAQGRIDVVKGDGEGKLEAGKDFDGYLKVKLSRMSRWRG